VLQAQEAGTVPRQLYQSLFSFNVSLISFARAVGGAEQGSPNF